MPTSNGEDSIGGTKLSSLIVAAAISGFVSGMPGAFLGSYVSIKLLENNLSTVTNEVSEIKADQKETQKTVMEISRQLSALQAVQAIQGGAQRQYERERQNR